MSDEPPSRDATSGEDAHHADPAVGVLEFASIAAGIVAADAMVKTSPLGSLYSGTVHPGKYVVLVSGDTASVTEAMTRGRDAAGEPPIDEALLPDIHPSVTAAVIDGGSAAALRPEALAIVELSSVASLLTAADAGVKAADVAISAMRLGDGLGGKSYVLFSGVVAEVEAAADRAIQVTPPARLLRSDVIPQLHGELAHDLAASLDFTIRVAQRPSERGA